MVSGELSAAHGYGIEDAAFGSFGRLVCPQLGHAEQQAEAGGKGVETGGFHVCSFSDLTGFSDGLTGCRSSEKQIRERFVFFFDLGFCLAEAALNGGSGGIVAYL